VSLELRVRRALNVAEGVCMFAASHGPATHGKRCKTCATKRVAGKRTERQKRIDAGICMFAASHGPATHGKVCDRCYEYEQRKHAEIRDKKRTA